MPWSQRAQTGPESHAAIDCKENSVFIQTYIVFNNTVCWGEIGYKAVLLCDATAYQGINNSLVKNGGFGLTLTNQFYRLYTVMSVQIHPWLFILDQGQKSHLQLLHVAESQQIVFRMSSLYSSTGRRSSNTSHACTSDAHQECSEQACRRNACAWWSSLDGRMTLPTVTGQTLSTACIHHWQ